MGWNNDDSAELIALLSDLCDYSDTYIFVKGTRTSPERRKKQDNVIKRVTFKTFVPFNDQIRKIKSPKLGLQIDF